MSTNSGISCTHTSDCIQEDICNYIEQELLPPDCGIKVQAEDDLLSIAYLDSLQFMCLVQFTEDNYKLKIPPTDLKIENFQTVSSLTKYLSGRFASV